MKLDYFNLLKGSFFYNFPKEQVKSLFFLFFDLKKTGFIK